MGMGNSLLMRSLYSQITWIFTAEKQKAFYGFRTVLSSTPNATTEVW